MRAECECSYCAREYHPWQQFALRILQENYNAETKALPANIIAIVKEKVGAWEGEGGEAE